MAPRIVPATGALLEEILDQTYAIWGEGLSAAAYARFNAAQLKTAWAAAHIERLALVGPGDRLLSTAKRYDLRARLDATPVRVLGIGAVFTPPDLRGQGFAAQIVEALLARGLEEGYDAALLFSAIGPDYYRRFGFEVVPLEQLELDVRQGGGSPAILVRAGDDGDTRFIAEMHQVRATASGCRFALDRGEDFIRFAVARKRLLAGLGPPGLRHLEYFVVEEGGRAAAYAVLLRSDGGRMLSECGDRDPTGARVGALLRALFARSPHERPPSIRAWLPPGFRPPQLRVARVERPSVIMMLRALRPGVVVSPPLAAHEVMYWLGDVV